MPDSAGDIVHAELRWPTGGAVVFGSTKHINGVHGQMRPGTNAIYVATNKSNDVDAVYERARDAGADVVQPPRDTEFGSGVGSYTFTTRDPEGKPLDVWDLPRCGVTGPFGLCRVS